MQTFTEFPSRTKKSRCKKWILWKMMNIFSQICVAVVLFCCHQHKKIFYFISFEFLLLFLKWFGRTSICVYYLFRTVRKCFYSHVKRSLSTPAYLVFKVKMPLIDPLACGLAKVAVLSILCSKTELQKKIGECEKELGEWE